jgi:hypothetical protein
MAAGGSFPNDIGEVSKNILELGILLRDEAAEVRRSQAKPKKSDVYLKNVLVRVENDTGGKIYFSHVKEQGEIDIMKNFTKLILLPVVEENQDQFEFSDDGTESRKPNYRYQIDGIHDRFLFWTTEGTVKFISEQEEKIYNNAKVNSQVVRNQAEGFRNIRNAYNVNKIILEKPNYDILKFGKVFMYFCLQTFTYPPEELYVLAIKDVCKENQQLYNKIDTVVNTRKFKDWINKNIVFIQNISKQIGIENADFDTRTFEWKKRQGYINRKIQSFWQSSPDSEISGVSGPDSAAVTEDGTVSTK